MKILVLGDSISGYSDLSSYLKWSHILSCMIEAKFGKDYAVVYNRGIGGNTTVDILDRLEDDALALKPDVTVLLIGGNDAAQDSIISKEATLANLRKIVASLKGVCDKVLLLKYHLFVHPGKDAEAWTHITDNLDAIDKVAQEKQCSVLNMDDVLREYLSDQVVCDDFHELPGWTGSDLYPVGNIVSPDAVHLNAGGEICYGRGVFNKLVELEWLG